MKNVLKILAIVVSTMMHSKIISAVELTGSVRYITTKMMTLDEKVDFINQLNDDDDFRATFVYVWNQHDIVQDILDVNKRLFNVWHQYAKNILQIS